MKITLLIHLFFLIYNFEQIHSETVLMTEVFAITIDPLMFNWTYEANDQYSYRPFLSNKPDLPSWINYIYSKRHHHGYLYGVPHLHNNDLEIEIVALNRKNYETRRHTLPIYVTEKRNPARHEVQLKIDNLNVDDMFDVHRMERLKDVFRKKLWKDSEKDLYVTFLESAIQLGARLPLKPNEGEGVVLRLGSSSDFSSELIELQDEVKPLWKLQSCPRDFKRTTVERFFREAGFALDWCAFRLLQDDGSALHHSSKSNINFDRSHEKEINLKRWRSISKEEVPQRSYFHEFMFTIIIPMLVMIVLVLLLSLILCFHHEGIKDELSDKYFDSIFHVCVGKKRSKHNQETSSVQMTQYENIQRATSTLRSLSSNREAKNAATDALLTPYSHTNSPSSSLVRTYCRPSPPPYPSSTKQEF